MSYSSNPRATLVDGSIIDGSTALAACSPYRVNFPSAGGRTLFVDFFNPKISLKPARIPDHVAYPETSASKRMPTWSRALLKRHRMSGKAVDIGAYSIAAAPAASAILTHLALRHAGLKPKQLMSV